MPLSFVEMVHYFSISFSIFNSQYVFFLHFRWVVVFSWQQLWKLMTTNEFLQYMTTSNAIDWDNVKKDYWFWSWNHSRRRRLEKNWKTKHSRRRFLTDKDNRLKSFQYYLKKNFTFCIPSNLWTEHRHFNNQNLTSIIFNKINFRKRHEDVSLEIRISVNTVTDSPSMRTDGDSDEY